MPLVLRANDGAGSTGGLNTINGVPIENYVRPLNTFYGYTGFLRRFEYIEKNFPELGKEIRERLGRVAFYKLPVELRELPDRVTGFHYRTEQCALQPMETDVIKVSQPCLQRLQDRSIAPGSSTPELVDQAITHEVLMALQPHEKNWEAVHFVGNLLFANPIDTQAVQEMLFRKKFGFFLTPENEKGLRLREKSYYLAEVLAKLEPASRTCQDGLRSMSNQAMLERYGGRAGLAQKNLSMVNFLLSPPDDTSLSRQPGGDFSMPTVFNHRNFEKGLSSTLMGFDAEESLGRDAVKNGCHEMAEVKVFPPEMCAFVENPRNGTREEIARLKKLYKELGSEVEKDLAEVRKGIARHKEFTDLLALLTTDAAVERAGSSHDPNGVLRALLPDLRSKRGLVRGLDHAARLQQVCAGLAALTPKVTAMMNAADAAEKRVIKPRAAGSRPAATPAHNNLGAPNISAQ